MSLRGTQKRYKEGVSTIVITLNLNCLLDGLTALNMLVTKSIVIDYFKSN